MIRDRGLQHWLPTYIAERGRRSRLRRQRSKQLTHLLFLVCDHFEPRHKAKTAEQPAERVRNWHAGYQSMQNACFAEFGLRPLHTWFYPPHHGYEHLPALAAMAHDGLGEVELHYHHDGDTEATLRIAMTQALSEFHRAGLLQQLGAPPRRRFGFIHGDWALDNSSRHGFCGVNSELSLLQELGCWGDLTMPSANECQTRKINAIYYAIDDRDKPKSHDWGENAEAGRPGREGFMLIQGPLGINWRGRGYPRVENASLTRANWGSADRIASWVDCHVHVDGRPEWLFIKLHTHGAVDADTVALFGEKAQTMYRTLASQYNDGVRFKVHFITARHAYNLSRAAEHGHGGDPLQYLDFEIPPPVTSRYWMTARHRLMACTSGELEIRDIEAVPGASITLRYPGIAQVLGAMTDLRLDARGSIIECNAAPGTELLFRLDPGVTPEPGSAAIARPAPGNGWSVVVPAEGRLRLSLAGASAASSSRPAA